MSKKVLVTGGAGYIGSHTVVELVKSGYDPIILDDYRNSDSSVLKRLSQIIGFEPMHVVCDVCDQNRIEEIVETYSISGVIHFAAYKAVGESVENPLKYYSNNITGLVSVLSVLKKRPEIPFVFSSSCTVYGEPMGLKEVNENNPIGAHESALIGELPVGKPNNLLPFITQTAADIHEKLVIFGKDYPTTDGTCVRDYIHVVDLAEAHVKAMDYLLSIEEGCHEIVNVGTGKGTSVLELVRAFEKENNMELNYVFGPKRSGDVIEIYANVDYAFSLLGWRSSRNIKDAVRDAWKWEKSIRNIK